MKVEEMPFHYFLSGKGHFKECYHCCLEIPVVMTVTVSCLLCSGVYFQGTTIGMAPIMSMCTAEQSGGIVMVSVS